MATPAFLGNGILRPFRRDQKNDFANAAGRDLVLACAAQVLGMRCRGPRGAGELLWRGDLGSRLYLLRHRLITPTLIELARHYSQDALRKWEPRIVVTRCSLAGDQQRRALRATIGFDLISRNVPSNRVILADMKVTVPLG